MPNPNNFFYPHVWKKNTRFGEIDFSVDSNEFRVIYFALKEYEKKLNKIKGPFFHDTDLKKITRKIIKDIEQHAKDIEFELI